jgi:hypothetical protein
MTNGTSAAVTEAIWLNEIQFPEFTAKLITDTFDALVAANIRQTDAFLHLVAEVSKTLATFIESTKDDIGGELILQVLAKVLPDHTSETGTMVKVGGTLTATDTSKLNTAVTIMGVTGSDTPNMPTGQLNQAGYNTILDAVAKRIAADKYSLLKEMVKMGVIQIVVEHGSIETKLVFITYGSTFYESQKTKFNRDDFNFQAKAKTGGFLSEWVKASASTSYNSVNISTARETNRDISGSQVQIYGSVRIDFKTNYSPLAG